MKSLKKNKEGIFFLKTLNLLFGRFTIDFSFGKFLDGTIHRQIIFTFVPYKFLSKKYFTFLTFSQIGNSKVWTPLIIHKPLY